jgi:hypothetical protein
VTATFGLPSLHEDDALRAVRTRSISATSSRAILNRAAYRIATGEVVASSATIRHCRQLGARPHVAAPAEIVLDDPTQARRPSSTYAVAGAAAYLQALPGAQPFARRLGSAGTAGGGAESRRSSALVEEPYS